MIKRNLFNTSVGVSVFCTLFLCSKNILAKDIGQINTDGANLISAPTLDSSVIEKMHVGQAVEIINIKNNFYKIRIDGIEAYADKNFVDPISVEGIINAEHVNIRALPSDDAQIISQANIGDKININAITGDWLVINFNNNKAYVSKKFVLCDYINKLQKVEPPSHKLAIVTSDNGLNLREKNSIDSTTVGAIPFNQVIDIVDDKDKDNRKNQEIQTDKEKDKKNNWTKVVYENKIGYVNSDYIEILEDNQINNNQQEQTLEDLYKLDKNQQKAEQIIEYAKRFIGTPYLWGGRNLNSAVDCSGFTLCVMKNFGIDLANTSKAQAFNGRSVERRQDLKTGDLVFFSNNGGNEIQHVGIYIGNGQFIHSASPNGRGVMISSLDESYYAKNYITGRRVI